MSAFQAALGGMVAAAGVGMVAVARNWPAPSGNRRARALVSDASLLDDLLGPPSPWTTFEHAPAPIRSGFHDCPKCGHVTGGSFNRDGWLCGECFTPTTIGGAP